MKTGGGLALICVGAILAFAVTASTPAVNLHTAGWVIMLVGLIGLFIPRRSYGWLGRRMLVRRTRAYPGGKVEEIAVPPYVARNPGTQRIRAGLPPRPTLLTDDPIEDMRNGEAATRRPAGFSFTRPARAPQSPSETEVIEDLYEEE